MIRVMQSSISDSLFLLSRMISISSRYLGAKNKNGNKLRCEERGRETLDIQCGVLSRVTSCDVTVTPPGEQRTDGGAIFSSRPDHDVTLCYA